MKITVEIPENYELWIKELAATAAANNRDIHPESCITAEKMVQIAVNPNSVAEMIAGNLEAFVTNMEEEKRK